MLIKKKKRFDVAFHELTHSLKTDSEINLLENEQTPYGNPSVPCHFSLAM